MLCAQASRPPGSVALTQGSKTPLFEPANPIFDSSRATSGQVLPWATSSRPCSRWSYRDSSLRRISSCNARMMVSESATVSGFILPGNHRSPRYAITYDAVYSGILPSLRSGQVYLDEAEPFFQDPRCQHRYAPMVLGIIPEF